MGLVAMVCPACGAKLEVEDGRDAFFCTYCGARVEREVQRVDLTGNVEIKSQALDTLLGRAETFIKLGDWDKAMAIYDEVADNYPHDYRGWWGKIVCETNGFLRYVTESKISQWHAYVQKMATESRGRNALKSYDEYISKCKRYEYALTCFNKQIEALEEDLSFIEYKYGQAINEKAKHQRMISKVDRWLGLIAGILIVVIGLVLSFTMGGAWYMAIIIGALTVLAGAFYANRQIRREKNIAKEIVALGQEKQIKQQELATKQDEKEQYEHDMFTWEN